MARRTVVVIVSALAFAACGWDWTVVPKSDGSGSDAGDGGAPESAIEGGQKGACRSSDQCAADEVCLFADFRCGAGVEGTCVPPTPEAKCLSGDPSAACGCDGETAKNRCAVEPKRTDLSIDGKCTPPPDTFRCGFLFCPKTTFCFEARTPDYNDFVCIPWECSQHTCMACPETKGKCEIATCSADADGNTLVVCTKIEGQ